MRALLIALLALGALACAVPVVHAADGPRTVEGCATAPAGLPDGAAVVFERAGQTRSVPLARDGCFRADLTDGRWTFHVDLPEGVRLRLLNPELTGFAPERPVLEISPQWAVPEQWLVLTDKAELSGRVTDDAGAPLTPYVQVVSTGDGDGANAFVSADGTWRALVAPGEYRVKFETADDRWMSRWLGGPDMPPFSFSDPAGTTVSVGSAQAADGLDAALNRTATVGGRLTDSQGQPLGGVEVQVWSDRRGTTAATATTGLDGRYSVGRLPPGHYAVYFATKRTVPTFYGGADLATDAEFIEVKPGADLTTIDGVSLVGGSVSGRVVDSMGRPIPRIQLTTIRGTMPQITPGMEAITGEDGTFDGGHVLRPGTFMLRAMGAVDSVWQPTVLRVGSTPVLLTSTPPLAQRGIEIVMYRIGEPLPPGIFPVSPDLLFGNADRFGPPEGQAPGPARTTPTLKALTIRLPMRCTTACAVKVTAATARRLTHRSKPARWLVGRGRAKSGDKRVRLRLSPAGRKAVQRGSLSVRAQVRPAEGRARVFALRLKRTRR